LIFGIQIYLLYLEIRERMMAPSGCGHTRASPGASGFNIGVKSTNIKCSNLHRLYKVS